MIIINSKKKKWVILIMKKIMIFSLAILCLLLGSRNVKAENIDISNGLECEEVVLQDNGIASKKCIMGFNVVDGEADYNNIKAKFTLENLIIDSLTLENDWYIESKTEDSYNLQTKASSLKEGYHKIGTIIFHKVVNADECKIKFKYDFSKINRSCTIYENNYYGKNGTIVDELTYQKECGNNVCTVLSDGTIYGKNGTVVDELTYQKECGNNICAILSDGTIYGKNGQITDQATFDIECNEKKTCTIVGGKYYDSKGNITTKENYMFDCFSGVENPKTGSLLPIITILVSGLLGFGILHIAKKYDRFI